MGGHRENRAVRLERIGPDIWVVSSKDPAQWVELPKVQIFGDSAYSDAFNFSPNSKSGLDSLALRSAVRLAIEEKTDAYFQFVLRENHTAPCGGDPETSPVVDRYRIYRASGKIEWLEPVEGHWQRYNPAQIR